MHFLFTLYAECGIIKTSHTGAKNCIFRQDQHSLPVGSTTDFYTKMQALQKISNPQNAVR